MTLDPQTGGGVLVVVTSNARRGAELDGLGLSLQLRRRGVNASCVALAGTTSSATLEIPVLGDAPLHPKTIRALRRRSRSASIVVAYGSSTLPACVLALARMPQPLLYRSIGNPGDWSRGRLHRARTALLFRRPDKVVALWTGAATSLRELYGVGESELAVIPTARDLTTYPAVTTPSRAAARRAIGLDVAGPVICLVGALSREKRPQLAIDAALSVPNSQVLVAGTGHLETTIRANSASAGDRVKMLGAVADVTQIMHASDLLLLTSETEGMPGVLIEALMCGLPFVATDVGGVSQVASPPCEVVPIDASSNDIARAVRRTLGRDFDPAQISAAAGKRFGWDAVIPSWLELLRELGSPFD